MTDWKENLQVQKESLRLGLAETEFSVVSFFKGFPRWKRILVLILAIAIIPTTIAVRYGVQYYTQWQLRGALISAHQSYIDPTAPELGPATITQVDTGLYAAYATIENKNLDVIAATIPFRFDFYDSSDQKVSAVSGTTYLLPGQKKYVMAPRIESIIPLRSATVTVGEFQWQKRLSVPEIDLKTPNPIVYNTLNPLSLIVEGVVVNSSAYRLGTVRIQFILYDKSGKILAISQREEYNLPAFGRRAYKQSWPNIYDTAVSRVVVLADTNAANNANLVVEDINQNSDLELPNSRE